NGRVGQVLLAIALMLPGCSRSGERVIKAHYSNGQPKFEMNLSPDRRKAECRYWFDNGKSEAAGRRVDDMPVGPWTFWYPSGGLRREANYSGGKLEGKVVDYHENGQRSSL